MTTTQLFEWIDRLKDAADGEHALKTRFVVFAFEQAMLADLEAESEALANR